MSGQLGLYFEAAVVITVLVLPGQVLELKARSAISGAIKALLGLAPKTARRIASDGSESEVDLNAIQVGDKLRVRPGEKVPMDGVLLEGSSSIDESMVSGESIPVQKNVNDKVTGGTINGYWQLRYEDRTRRCHTLLAQILKMVSEAQRTPAPIQRLADVVASYFVPAVLFSAVVTFVVWAIYGSMGRSPHYAHALINEVAGLIGTLTEGKPKLTSLIAVECVDAIALLQAAANLEKASEHPFAAAILAGAKDPNLELSSIDRFELVTGKGLKGNLKGKQVAIGNAAFMTDLKTSAESSSSCCNHAWASSNATRRTHTRFGTSPSSEKPDASTLICR
jgi:P-type Cu+ transporter